MCTYIVGKVSTCMAAFCCSSHVLYHKCFILDHIFITLSLNSLLPPHFPRGSRTGLRRFARRLRCLEVQNGPAQYQDGPRRLKDECTDRASWPTLKALKYCIWSTEGMDKATREEYYRGKLGGHVQNRLEDDIVDDW